MTLGDTVEWLTFRRDQTAAGKSTLRVGHVDIFARPGTLAPLMTLGDAALCRCA